MMTSNPDPKDVQEAREWLAEHDKNRPKPTIHELEELLSGDEAGPIEILPDGQVRTATWLAEKLAAYAASRTSSLEKRVAELEATLKRERSESRVTEVNEIKAAQGLASARAEIERLKQELADEQKKALVTAEGFIRASLSGSQPTCYGCGMRPCESGTSLCAECRTKGILSGEQEEKKS